MLEDNRITELRFQDYTKERKNYGSGSVVLMEKYAVDFEYIVEYDGSVRLSDFTAFDEDGEVMAGIVPRFRIAIELLIEKDTQI
jgi:hypothetical protein